MKSIRQLFKPSLLHCPPINFYSTSSRKQQSCTLIPHVGANQTKSTRRGRNMAKLLKCSKKPTFNEKEFLQANGFVLGRCIGEGTYSKVYAAIQIDKGAPKRVACKIIDKKLAGDEFIKKFLPRELAIVQHLQHANIVHLHHVFGASDKIFITMDYCHNGDLLEYVRDRGPLSESLSKHFFRQIVNAISYLHAIDIAHRDLKCENILLSGSHVKLGDFGFARVCVDGNGKKVYSETYCGSAAYAAPEIIQGIPYDPKMYDIWALGCILYIMVVATMPFDDANVKKMLKCQLSRSLCLSSLKTWNELDGRLRILIGCLLEPHPERRVDICSVRNSLWMQGVDTITDKEDVDGMDHVSLIRSNSQCEEKIDLDSNMSKSSFF